MKTIFVSDIFGLSSHLNGIAERVTDNYEILDPYGGETVAFTSEEEAYERFCETCGLAAYTDLVRERIRITPGRLALVGFSVGAAAVWNVLGKAAPGEIEKAVCFYGSRIRENPGILPPCETFVIFPKEERGFKVAELAGILSKTPNVRVTVTPYLHGFMNRLSANYDETGYREYVSWLIDTIPHS